MRKIAISDIHGCARSLEKLLRQVAPAPDDELYFLGDFIDRGPDSKGVIDQVLALRSEVASVRCLLGNHEDGLRQSIKDPYMRQHWIGQWGGQQTLRSFSVQHPKDIPEPYLRFFLSLEWVIETRPFILVHAGLNFLNDDPLAVGEDMIYIRNWYPMTDHDWLGERYIVHGHTPVSSLFIEENLEQLDTHRCLNIDAGCYAVQFPGMGNLCAFDMSGRHLYFQENIDRMDG